MSSINENYSFKKYFQEIVQDQVKTFDELIRWGDEEKEEFAKLLSELEKPFDKETETTKQKGDRLENLVEFIIKKTFFYDVYKNIHTETNEIDEIIILSNQGKQAMTSFNISKDLLPIDSDIFLGECKNYKTSLGVTYVGKFYSLLVATDVPFGIIFTQKGLSGETEGYEDAYGLTKVLRLIEKYKNDKELYIITFANEDYHLLLEGHTFFELIKAKMLELQMASNYQNFLKDNEHESIAEIQKTIRERQ